MSNSKLGKDEENFLKFKKNKEYSNGDIILEESYGEIKPFRFNCRKLMSFVGPGFLMSIAYLDPGNIAGDLEAGLKGGYSLIWTLMWSTILGLYY
jgi:hypothetical protein